MNRGIARRPLFEDREDIRFFLSRIAHEVRRGTLEIHAYCILTTHFHALVRSLVGELSEAMRRAQNEYSRFFNRRHRRDGTLVRGRYTSRLVESIEYRQNVVRYIDDNPVQARLAEAAWRYPWCSAAHYVRPRGPIWLAREWIESWVRAAGDADAYHTGDYRTVVSGRLRGGIRRLVDERLRCTRSGRDELDDLVLAAPASMRAWMRKKAELADGTPPGAPVCDASSIQRAVEEHRSRHGPWSLVPRQRVYDGWSLAEVALLRALAGLTIQGIASTMSATSSKIRRHLELHPVLMEQDENYGLRVGELAATSMRRCHGVGLVPKCT